MFYKGFNLSQAITDWYQPIPTAQLSESVSGGKKIVLEHLYNYANCAGSVNANTSKSRPLDARLTELTRYATDYSGYVPPVSCGLGLIQ